MGIPVSYLCKALGTTGVQPGQHIDRPGRDDMLCQVVLSSTGSVTIEGRISDEQVAGVDVFPWVQIGGPYTITTLVPLAYCPWARINIGTNAGLVTAGIIEK